MLMTKLPEILICSNATRHGMVLTLSSSLILLLLLTIGQYFWQAAKLPLIFLVLAAFVCLVVGIVKIIEPQYSFKLNPKSLKFIHRKGIWSLPWSLINNIRPVKNVSGIATEELAYVGLTLTNINEIAARIPPRLANHLIHEQRPILLYCVSRGLLPIEEIVINFNEFVIGKKVLKGPVAGFLHQCVLLHAIFGAHLFIPQTCIDRSMDDFSALLRDCKNCHSHYLTE
mgnify:FL=1